MLISEDNDYVGAEYSSQLNVTSFEVGRRPRVMSGVLSLAPQEGLYSYKFLEEGFLAA